MSAVLWFWYKGFGFIFGPANSLTWILAVIFLAFTVRSLAHWPNRVSARTGQQMRELQPSIDAIHKKYGKDRQRMALEMQKLQKLHNFNPILGFASRLVLVPRLLILLAFIHILISFNRTADWLFHGVRLSVEANRATANYVFSPTDVGNFLDADLFGASLGTNMAQTTGLDAFSHYEPASVTIVGVSLAAITAIITYAGARWQFSRRNPSPGAFARSPLRTKLSYLIVPAGLLALSPWLLLGFFVYCLAHYAWSLGVERRLWGTVIRPRSKSPSTAPPCAPSVVNAVPTDPGPRRHQSGSHGHGGTRAGVSLTKGEIFSLTKETPGLIAVSVSFGWDVRVPTGLADDNYALDASALACGDNAQVLSDAYFVFYNNVRSADGSITHMDHIVSEHSDGDDAAVEITLAALPPTITRVFFPVSIYDADNLGLTFGQVQNAYMRVLDKSNGVELARYDLSEDASTATATLFGELYRCDGGWKFRAIGQGYASGLAGIARDFGVNI